MGDEIQSDNFEGYRNRFLKASADENTEELRAILSEALKDETLLENEKSRIQVSINKSLKAIEGEPTLKGDTVAGKKLIATSQDLENVQTIGHLIGFSVSEREDYVYVPNEALDKYWNDNGLPQNFKPNPIREKDAFKVACRSFEGTEPVNEEMVKTFGSSYRVRWDVTALSPNEYQITRKIIELIKDEKSKRDKLEEKVLSHENICKFIMDETTTEVSGKREGTTKKQVTLSYRAIAEKDEYKDLTAQLKEQLVEQIEWYKNHTTGKKIRDAIRDMVYRCHGVNLTMSSGGAWFVPVEYESTVARMKAFVKWVGENHTYISGRATLLTIPVIDDYDVKAQIEQDVYALVENRMEKMLRDTLRQLEGTDEDKVEELLARKIAEHGKNIKLLDDYKKILSKKINVELEFIDYESAKIKGGKQLSGRAKALLRKLTTTDQFNENATPKPESEPVPEPETVPETEPETVAE